MPVIHTHVSVSTTAEQREALKSAYGKAITAVPGKSEGWLMCPFEDNMPIYFGGDDSKPAAYVEVNVFGRSVPGSAWEKLTEQIMAAWRRNWASRPTARTSATPPPPTGAGTAATSDEVSTVPSRFAHIANLSPHLRKHTVFPASRFGRQLLTKFLPFLRGHGVATFARNRRN